LAVEYPNSTNTGGLTPSSVNTGPAKEGLSE
jgi:hypothetical protein